MQPRITKLDIQMFHDEFWKADESQEQCRRGSLHSCECWLLLAIYSLMVLRYKAGHPSVFRAR